MMLRLQKLKARKTDNDSKSTEIETKILNIINLVTKTNFI